VGKYRRKKREQKVAEEGIAGSQLNDSYQGIASAIPFNAQNVIGFSRWVCTLASG
jgi:hypothetical protein